MGKPPIRFKVPAKVAQLVRGLRPDIKRKVRVRTPKVIQIVAIGARDRIYEETLRLVSAERAKP